MHTRLTTHDSRLEEPMNPNVPADTLTEMVEYYR